MELGRWQREGGSRSDQGPRDQETMCHWEKKIASQRGSSDCEPVSEQQRKSEERPRTTTEKRGERETTSTEGRRESEPGGSLGEKPVW